MSKEVKKETDWLGNEKWGIYEDGKKIGESKSEKNWRGEDRLVTYDTDGRKVSETRHETNWRDEKKEVTYDTSGNKMSETKHETSWRGEPKDVIYEGGRKIGELKREDGITDIILDTKRKVLHESSSQDVDLTRRATRGGKREESTGQSHSADYLIAGLVAVAPISPALSSGGSEEKKANFLTILGYLVLGNVVYITSLLFFGSLGGVILQLGINDTLVGIFLPLAWVILIMYLGFLGWGSDKFFVFVIIAIIPFINFISTYYIGKGTVKLGRKLFTSSSRT